MGKTAVLCERVYESVNKWVSERPITFEEFLDLFGKEDYVELIDGSVVEKTVVQLDHEKLFVWLHYILGIWVQRKNLGIVLGSRTAVEIGTFRGRLPDLLFVRREREAIVQQKAIYGAPDLIIELISPNDRRSDIVALETDYCAIGVEEIVFMDQRRRRVRILRRRERTYEETILTSGSLILETLDGLTLQTDWLFVEPRPDVLELLLELLHTPEPPSVS